MIGFVIVVAMLALFWLILIRPRQRQVRAQQQQLNSLEVGDEIVTAGGLYGTVRSIGDDEIRLEIAPELQVRVAKRAIAGVLTEKQPALEAAAKPENDGS